MATRKAAFEAYYKANPDKLKGKSVDEAYAAMRREAGRKKTGNRAATDKISMSAVERRLAKANQLSRENKNKSSGSSSLPVGLSDWKKVKLPVGFGSNQNGGTPGGGKLPSLWKIGESPRQGKADRDSKLADLERRSKNNSSKGGRRA